jgi:hypothetical protein
MVPTMFHSQANHEERSWIDLEVRHWIVVTGVGDFDGDSGVRGRGGAGVFYYCGGKQWMCLGNKVLLFICKRR